MANLKVGSRGQAVKEVQAMLRDILNNQMSIDGSFGPMTKAKVVSFQKMRNLTTDGIVGPTTLNILKGYHKSRSFRTTFYKDLMAKPKVKQTFSMPPVIIRNSRRAIIPSTSISQSRSYSDKIKDFYGTKKGRLTAVAVSVLFLALVGKTMASRA